MECNLVTIEQSRYDALIRAEVKLNMLMNAIEDQDDYTSLEELKKHFGIPRKETKE